MPLPSTRPADSKATLERPGGKPLDVALESSADADSSESEAWTNRRATEQAVRAAQARQLSGRRRLVDPATCERDYAADEVEFMNAMQHYKKLSGRMFPTWSEVLEVLISLGYRKIDATVQDSPLPDTPPPAKMARA